MKSNKKNKDDAERFEVIKLAKVVLWLMLIIGTFLILKFFGDLFKPLVLALIFWYLIRILSNYLTSIRIGNFRLADSVAKIISLFIITFILILFINLIVVNIKQIVTTMDELQSSSRLVEQITSYLGIENLNEHLKNIPGSKELRPFLTQLVNSLTQWVGYFIVFFIYLIFVLMEEYLFQKKLDKIYKSSENFEDLSKLIAQMNDSIKRYLTVKTFASFLTAFLAYWALFFIGVKFALLWAFIIFAFNFIPYIGSFVATAMPSLFAAIQFDSFSYFIWTFLFVQACQTLVANFIEPKIVGSSLNLSPLVVMLTLTIWGNVWGVMGMLIAVPMTSILVIILAQFETTQSWAIFLSQSGDIDKMIVQPKPKTDKQGSD